MSRQRRTTGLVEGALLASLAVVLVLAGVYLPVVGTVFVLLSPVTLVVLVVRHGFRAGLLTAVVAGIVLALFLPPVIALSVMAAFAPVGLALGVGARRKYPAFALVALGAVACLVSLGLTVGVSVLFLKINPILEQLELQQEAFARTVALYQRLGVGEEQLALIRQQSGQAVAAMKLLLPVSVVTASVMLALLDYGVAGLVLRRLRYPWPSLPPFAHWRVPLPALVIYAAALGVGFAGGRYGLQSLQVVAQNLFYLFLLVFLVQGLAVAWFFLGRYQVPAAFKFFLAAFGLLNPVGNYLVVLLGISEAFFNLRGL